MQSFITPLENFLHHLLSASSLRFYSYFLFSLLCPVIIDTLTAFRVSTSIFYWIPIFILTWREGWLRGGFCALLCGSLWLFFRYWESPLNYPLSVLLWNASIRTIEFILVSATIGVLRELLLKSEKEVEALRTFLPICAYCKKIRNDEGYWEQVEGYISKLTPAEFTHGICPECFKVEMKKIEEIDPSSSTYFDKK